MKMMMILSLSLLKNTEIEMNTRIIGKAHHIPIMVLLLMKSTWTMKFYKISFFHVPMTNNKLQPIPRLIGRILAYNICLKKGSFN